MKDDNSGSVAVGGGGVGFCSILTVVFIILKLCKVIDWNWFWVLSPTIFSASLWLLLFIVVIIIAIATRNK